MVYILTLGVYWWDPCYHIKQHHGSYGLWKTKHVPNHHTSQWNDQGTFGDRVSHDALISTAAHLHTIAMGDGHQLVQHGTLLRAVQCHQPLDKRWQNHQSSWIGCQSESVVFVHWEVNNLRSFYNNLYIYIYIYRQVPKNSVATPERNVNSCRPAPLVTLGAERLHPWESHVAYRLGIRLASATWASCELEIKRKRMEKGNLEINKNTW